MLLSVRPDEVETSILESPVATADETAAGVGAVWRELGGVMIAFLVCCILLIFAVEVMNGPD